MTSERLDPGGKDVHVGVARGHVADEVEQVVVADGLVVHPMRSQEEAEEEDAGALVAVVKRVAAFDAVEQRGGLVSHIGVELAPAELQPGALECGSE